MRFEIKCYETEAPKRESDDVTSDPLGGRRKHSPSATPSGKSCVAVCPTCVLAVELFD